ncbi:23S rRNA (uracil(1939)-C(5))-methyltransferase RlmD [Candidatus Poribacteria bacterium]|nr:23S rRNA (uracil(1939)-C(5))-methyltransferase RlmD [Candidatus Poribacteria bacterium]
MSMGVKGKKPAAGDLVSLELESLNYSDQAVGRLDGFVVFVSGGVPGDKVLVRIEDVKKNYAVAEIADIVEASPIRCNPPCVHFTEGCGGCQWQQIEYKHQVYWKREILIQALNRIGKQDNIPEIKINTQESPTGYRNKLRVFSANSSRKFGLKTLGTHHVVPINKCLVSSEKINSLSPLFRGEVLSRIGSLNEISIRNSSVSNKLMLLCNYGVENLDDHVAELSRLQEVSSVYYRVDSQVIHAYGDTNLIESVNGLDYYIGPRSFFQVNKNGLKQMIRVVKEMAGYSNKIILDAHSGVGTFALQLADRGKTIWGTDISREAVCLASINADMNGIKNTRFRQGTAEYILQKDLNGHKIDLVILDPPRKGCSKRDLKALIEAKPRRIIYISCNPTTLSRDINKLTQNYYKLSKLALIDMFPMTYHLETIALLCLQ